MRHAALRTLSLEHQVLTVHSNRMQSGNMQAVRRYLDFMDASLRHHLDEEEKIVLKGIQGIDLPGIMRSANHRLRSATDLLRVSVFDPSMLSDHLPQVVEAIRDHVRLCEFEVFDDVQDALSDVQLKKMHQLLLAMRKRDRPHALTATARAHWHID